MPVDRELLAKAYRNPHGLRFEEALRLATELGFEEVRVKGSHHLFRHPQAQKVKGSFPRPLNLQEGADGKAKGYQVRQMLRMAEALGTITTREG